MLADIMPSGLTPAALHHAPESHYFFNTVDVDSFTLMLRRPHEHFIEMREYVQMGNVLEFIRNEYPHTSLSLTTDTAFRQPVADFYTQHLARLRPLSPELMNDIRTCLQEAIMNSIIHGNLKVEHDKNDIADFPDYLERVSTALKKEEYALKRISLFTWFTMSHITVCVADEGPGFAIEQPPYNPVMPYGRGLPLIRAIAQQVWQLRPNHISMQFALA